MSLTSVIRYVQALDTSSSTGAGKTGLAFSDITAKYLAVNSTLTSLTTETIATLGTYQAPSDATHIRIKELAGSDPTKGIYEVHFHNTQVAGDRIWLFLSASGAAFQPMEVDLIADEALNRIGSGQVELVNPVAVDGLTLTLYSGDDYNLADGNALDWTDTGANWPDLTSATIALRILAANVAALTVVGSVITPSGAGKKVRAEPTKLQTATLAPGVYDFEVVATLAVNLRVHTLVSGRCEVR